MHRHMCAPIASSILSMLQQDNEQVVMSPGCEGITSGWCSAMLDGAAIRVTCVHLHMLWQHVMSLTGTSRLLY